MEEKEEKEENRRKDEPSLSSLIKIYGLNQNWLSLADTKGGLVLSVNGVLLGFMVSRVHQVKILLSGGINSVTWIFIMILILYAVTQFLSCFYGLSAIFPRRIKNSRGGKTSLFGYAITQQFPKPDDTPKFIEEVFKLTDEDIKKDVSAQMHIDALVCNAKYISIKRSIKLLVAATVFAIIIFVILSLLKDVPGPV